MNGENELGFHLGDGATAILVTGDEYHDVFPLWDWRRVPGVTCAFPADAPPPRLSDRNRLGGSAFAGGVSDDEFGVAAMRVSRGGVEANKAWFFLGDSVLCPGNSIASADPRMPVITSVNQTWARGPIVGRNGVLFTAGRINETNGSALAWVHHDGIGYVFPGGGAVRSGTERKSSSWRAINRIDGRSAPVEGEVFSVWLEHGRATVEQPGEYHYIVIPGLRPDAIEGYMRTKSPRVLANLPSLQAVASAANDLAQFVFREAGAAMLPDGRIIEVDAPCLLQWRRTRTSETLAAGNPAHDLRRLSVTVRSRGGASGSRQVHFGFPSGVESARPLVVRLSPDHPPGVP